MLGKPNSKESTDVVKLGLAHLVSQFTCRVIVDASSNPPVSQLKLR